MLRDIFDIAIVGAGIPGLCVARALRRRGVRRIVVLDRFPVGHARGSSHGSSRITRSSYHDPLYVRLAARARSEDWPALVRDLERLLIEDAPGLFFGPESPRLRAFAQATLATSQEVEAIEVADARRRFPQFTFADAGLLLLDRSAGVIRAEVVMDGLRRWLAAAGVEVRHGVRAQAWRRLGEDLEVVTDAAVLRAGGIVLAAGAWVGEFVPALRSRLTVVRQHVAYLRLAAGAAMRAPAFPVWAWIGAATDDFFYGLPDAGEGGVKLGRHLVAGPGDDPEVAASASEHALADVEAFARRTFAAPVVARVHADTCLYTATADEHFVLDALPGEPRVVVVSACSGHGFKFGPTVGELAASFLVDGVCPPREFSHDGPTAPPVRRESPG